MRSSRCVAVRGLDAIDGTPVLDLEPYFAEFDAVAGARAPAWVAALMRGYFWSGRLAVRPESLR